VRDIALPFLWLAAWSSSDFAWRGNLMNVDRAHDERLPRPAPRPGA
jgi:hypothetical protein